MQAPAPDFLPQLAVAEPHNNLEENVLHCSSHTHASGSGFRVLESHFRVDDARCTDLQAALDGRSAAPGQACLVATAHRTQRWSISGCTDTDAGRWHRASCEPLLLLLLARCVAPPPAAACRRRLLDPCDGGVHPLGPLPIACECRLLQMPVCSRDAWPRLQTSPEEGGRLPCMGTPSSPHPPSFHHHRACTTHRGARRRLQAACKRAWREPTLPRRYADRRARGPGRGPARQPSGHLSHGLRRGGVCF